MHEADFLLLSSAKIRMNGTVFIPPFAFMVCTTKSLLSHSNRGILGLVCEVFFNKFQIFNQFWSQGRYISCNFGSCVDGTRELVEGLHAKGIMC